VIVADAPEKLVGPVRLSLYVVVDVDVEEEAEEAAGAAIGMLGILKFDGK
jgi:hypothetical protein